VPDDRRPEPGGAPATLDRTLVTTSEAETESAAAQVAAGLVPGDVLLLTGNLGAGKTAFVRGLARGLGLDPGVVSSPTFALIHEYRGGRLPLFHADLYRLDRAHADDLGLDELGAADGVLAIEWPDRLAHLPQGQDGLHGPIRVTLDAQEPLDGSTRRIVIRRG
jgi:tRNA threonylcarbamoyladenosine biosynthesis protein TsaE